MIEKERDQDFMNLFEIIFIGLALSMGAVAVSTSNGMVYTNITKDKEVSMPILYGVFQGIMSILGFYTGRQMEDYITRNSEVVIFILLVLVGYEMIKEGLSKEEETSNNNSLTYKVLFIQGLVNSIYTYVVAISFCASEVNAFISSAIIAVITFICSKISMSIDKKFRDILRDRAQIIGGIILILIGIKFILQYIK